MNILKYIGVIIFEIIILKNANSQDMQFLNSGNELSVVIRNETYGEIYFVKSANDKSRCRHQKNAFNQINYANGDYNIMDAQLEKQFDSATAKTAAEETDVRKGTYNCWIYSDCAFNYKVRRGYIHSTGDSDIVFKISASGNTFYAKDWLLSHCHVPNIEKIKLRRKGSVGKGILVGAGVGFLFGGILGFAGIPDYGIFESLPPEENAMAGGLVFSFPGMIIGGIAGSFRIKIPINNNQFQYEKRKKVIAGYSIIKSQF